MVDFTDNNEMIQADAPQVVTPMKVTAVVVITIILGCLYLLGGIGGAASLAVQTFVPDAFEPQFDTDNPQMKLQMDFQQGVNGMSRRYFWPFVIQTVAFTVMGILLLVHGVQALRKDDAVHYQRLGQYLLIALGLEILGAILAGVFQAGQWSIVQGLTPPPEAGAQAKLFRSILVYSTIAGIVLAWVWIFAKLLFLALGATVAKNHAALLAEPEKSTP